MSLALWLFVSRIYSPAKHAAVKVKHMTTTTNSSKTSAKLMQSCNQFSLTALWIELRFKVRLSWRRIGRVCVKAKTKLSPAQISFHFLFISLYLTSYLSEKPLNFFPFSIGGLLKSTRIYLSRLFVFSQICFSLVKLSWFNSRKSGSHDDAVWMKTCPQFRG